MDGRGESGFEFSIEGPWDSWGKIVRLELQRILIEFLGIIITRMRERERGKLAVVGAGRTLSIVLSSQQLSGS
jgi:hypothetical protein